MAYTYSKIASVTVGSGGVSSIDFLAIPQNYTDLVIKLSLRADRSGTTFTQLGMRINGYSTAYSTRYLEGTGSTTASGVSGVTTYFGYDSMPINSTNSTTSTFSSIDIYLPNYAGSNYKTGSIDFVNEQNSTTATAKLAAALSSNSAPITSISFNEPNNNSNFAQYSSATLYGIKAEV